ncbi:MAG TPA: DUF1186 domain-containing protein [Candidatus Binatia bacterium]|jgi:hypothetical protein|nr:DUF1186 domain-containing protein [Candidatus Binatia bacterium]
MTIPEIIKELEPYNRRFPMEAMRAAIEQREAITTELLGIVEAIAANPTEVAKREEYMLPVFALYLLAQFRETRAYPAIVEMFSAPGETSYELVGDTVTEGLKQIFASVYDGNPAPLQGLFENEQTNEYVRSAVLGAFLVLEHTGQMPPAEVVEYFRSLFRGKLQRLNSFVWACLVSAVADLPAPELLEEVRRAYAEDLVDEDIADLKGIERDLAAPEPPSGGKSALITDAIAEMKDWACFRPKDSGPTEPPESEVLAPASSPPAPSSYVAPTPYVREPKIGRNDPCPCGSGKKFKKCCGKG